MSTNITQGGPVVTARQLASLDAVMRHPLPHRRAVSARVAFFEQAVRLYATRRLNRLGALCPDSLLGDRSMDVVFEDPRYSEDVVASIVALAKRDDMFAHAIAEQLGASMLAFWRMRATRQRALFDSA